MNLSFEQACDIILKQPHKHSLEKARRDYVRYNVHVNGVGVAEYLKKMEGFENEQQINLRRKIAHSIKHIFAQNIRNFDAVFSATGGSVIYNLSPNNEKQLRSILNEVKYGISLRQYLSDYWKNRYFCDPNGCILWEVGMNETYPTIKDINSIYEFQQNGVMLDYLIFEPVTGEQAKSKGLNENYRYYRVIDDSFDALYERKGDDTFNIVKEYSYTNYLGYVPAILNSNIPDPTDINIKISPFEDCIELADEYLRDMSIHSIYKKFHGFPLYWQNEVDCSVCEGTGIVDGGDCYMCKGTGKDLRRDVSKVISVERPLQGEPVINQPAGYIVPPIEVSAEQRAELDWLQRHMNYAIWSTYETEQQVTKTATERMLIEQGKYNRLSGFSDFVEMIEQNCIDIVGKFYFDTAYKGCNVSYGKNYYILSYADMYSDYIESKKNGANESTLTEKYIRYLNTRFRGQPQELQKQLIIMKSIPFFHIDVEKVKSMGLPPIDVFARIYADDFFKTIPIENIILQQDTLKTQLYDYAQNMLNSVQTNIDNQIN